MEIANNSLFETIRKSLRGHVDSFTYGRLLDSGIQVSVVAHYVREPETRPFVISSFGAVGDSHPELINEADRFISSLSAYPEKERVT